MYKIRIDAVGFDSYTGNLGVVPFTNGISDREVTEQEASRLGAIIKIVKLDDDVQVGAGSNIISAMKSAVAPVAEKLNTQSEESKKTENFKYSRDDLEELASKDGIKGIRKVAEEFNVKGVQIKNIIDDIMKKQGEE